MADEQQSNLPIEELGIDLVVNSGDNFVSDMSKAGRQMTTFSQQIGRLVNSLPMLNLAMQDLATQLSNINNRVSNVKKVAGALDQLGKMPNTVKNIGTNATNAALAVDKLYTSLEKAQARMKGLRDEEYAMRLEMQRKAKAPIGAESDPNSQNKGAKVTHSKVDPSTVAATTDTAAANREAQAAKAKALAAAKIATQTTDLVRRVLNDPKNNDLSVAIQLDVEEGKIKEETAQALAAAVMAAGKAAGGPEARAAERIGVYIADGIGKGMSEAEDAVVKGSNDLAQHILTAMKNALGIHSPSRAANVEVGQEIPPGVAEGIEEKTPVAEEAAREMARKVMAAAAAEGRARAKATGADLGASAGASMRVMMTKRMMADLKKLGYSEQEINVATPSQAGDIIGGSVTRGGAGATPKQATVAKGAATKSTVTKSAAAAQQAGKDAGKKIVEQASKGVEQGTQSAVDDVGPTIRRKAAKIAGELKQIETGQGPLNDRDFETASGMNERVDAALQARLKQSTAVQRRANVIIDNVAESVAFLQSLDPEIRDALKAASGLRVARKLTSNRGENVLYQGAIEDSLIAQMNLAGAKGTAPGTEAIGSQKVKSAYVPALGRVARWKQRGGSGVSQGHNAGMRDFTGALYQEKMRDYADQGGLDTALMNAKPDSPEWKALAKYYSPVTTSFPWQPQPARVPKNFKGDKDRLEQATAAAAKYIIKAMGLDKEAASIQHKRLGSQAGTASFDKFYNEMPEMQAFRDVGARDVKRYLRDQIRVNIDKQRVVDKQGDPQIEQATSEYYQKAHEIIGRQDATLSEIIDGLNKVNDQIKADLRAKFETTQEPVFKMLSERDDPVIKRTIDYLKKFGNRQSTTNPGQTIAEVLNAWADVWDFLKNKFGGQQGASDALSAYEHYMNKIETPAMRNDLMPDFPANLQVRRVRGAPRQIDKDLAVKRRQQTLDAELAFRDTQHYRQSRVRNAVDFREAQGSRKIATLSEQARIKDQVPDSAAIGVDREKVLEASNAAISIEWELKAQEDAINKAAETYAKKNGRTLKQVNQAVENLRTGKNKTPGKALTDLALMIAEYDRTLTRWEAATNAYLEKAIPAQQAASKSIGKGIARGELRTRGARYTQGDDGPGVNAEGIGIDPRAGANAGRVGPFEPSRFERAPRYEDTHTRNLVFRPGGLIRGADGKPEIFDTSRTKREYQPEMLGSTAEAAYAPAYKKPRGYRAPEISDKERIARSQRAGELQKEFEGMRAPMRKQVAGGDLELAARRFGTYSRDFNELLRIKTSELGLGVKEALDSINTAANNYIGKAVKYIDSFQASGFLEKGAAEKFNAGLIGAQAQIIDLKNRANAGEKINPADVKTVVKTLHENIKSMGMAMEASTQGLDELEKAADKATADAAAAEQAKITARQAGGWQAVNSNQARGWRAANGSAISTAGQAAGQAAGKAAAKQTVGTFTFPDDWVVKLVNAIGQAADKIVAAVRGIRIELTGGGVAENVGPTEAQIKAGRRPQTDAEKVRGLANTQADLIRTSEVDAYRASHTAMRQVRQANDLNPNEVERLQAAIDAWRSAAIKNATDSISEQASRGDVVDAFRASRSQSDLDLQKIVGPEIRKSIQNQETAVSEREMRTLKTAFDDIARKEREVTTALQGSAAPAAQLEADLKAVAAAAELARNDVIDFSQSAESFQILDAQIDQVVNSFKEMGEVAKFAAKQADRTPLMQRELATQTRADSITRDAERLKSSAQDKLSGLGVPQTDIDSIIQNIDAAAGKATAELTTLLDEARKGGIGAENSMAAFNLELQRIRANASLNIDALRRMLALKIQTEQAAAKNTKLAAAGQASQNQGGTSDVDRAIGAKDRAFKKAATLGQSVASEPFANQKTVTDLLWRLTELKAQTDQAVKKALDATINASGSERANAVRAAIGSTKAELDGVTESLRNIEKISRSVTSEFQKIDHAAYDTATKLSGLRSGGVDQIKTKMPSSLAINMSGTQKKAIDQFSSVVPDIEKRLASMYDRARQAAMAGDKAAVSQLVWEIRKLGKQAEETVGQSIDRILKRATAVDDQISRIGQKKDYAKDPQSFLQERTIGKAKGDGLSGWINRRKLNLQEAAATAEMAAAVAKAREQFSAYDATIKPVIDMLRAFGYTVKWVYKIVTAPITVPFFAMLNGLSFVLTSVSDGLAKIGRTFLGIGRNSKGAMQDFSFDTPAIGDELKQKGKQTRNVDGTFAATGQAAQKSTPLVRKFVDTITLGATKASTSVDKLTTDLTEAGAAAGKSNTQKGMKKLFADMGTGVGMGFGMSFSYGIINSIQGMAQRIQSTITGIISNGMSALIETEMRKMTIQSFVSQDMMEQAGPDANFGDIWTEAKDKANDYYQQIVDIAKISSFSRAPLLDVFNNMQVGGLSAENAASVTRAATMFGDAFMPGQKQMLDTFGQQMMQMLSQGVAQQMDLKLLAQQGIPVYDMLAKNLPQYQGMDKNKAQGQIFDDLGKGQIGATQALEAITKGMVDAAANMKGKVMTTFSGLMSTFQDLMLEKSEAIMQPVAENLMKPFIEFANDFLQSNPVTNAIKAFGEQINGLSQTIMTGVATALGVLYGLWNALPAPIQNAVKAIAAAVTIMGALTAAIAGIAAVGALLAPIFGVISTGMLVATGAIGAFIGAWMTNLMGFRDWLTGWATWAYNWAVYLGKSLADGLLTNVGEFSKAGAAAINGFMGNFMGNMESIYASIQAFGQNVGNAIGAGMQQIGDWISAAIDWLWQLPQNAWDVVKSVVEAFWEVPKNLEGIGQAMWSWGQNVINMFAQGMQGAVTAVFDALQAIGDMFTEWLEPGSPPKLLPDLTVWGTGAADAYLEGWTKADFGIMNDLAGKLEEAFAIDEGAMKQGELAAVRGAVAQMVDSAIGGTVDTSGIMNAIPGWGGRAESVQRLADAYANLAVTQHGLTVEQEALDRITAQYDARLKPLQSKLESIRNKQEALDLTSQIKEYQNVLDNIYATDEQKKAASLKMDELKLTQDINNIEMDRDKLTDPINDRIGKLTYENQLAQDAVDIANERWAVEVGMLKAGSKKDGAGGAGETGSAADKAAKDKAGGAGSEKNRQFTQPKLNVPGITGKNGLGAIGSKMQDLSDKIKGYFSDMGEKAKPLVDALNGMGAGVTTIKDAIDTGFQSGAFSSDKGFAGFLNNVGAALAATATNIDTAKTSIAGFVTQVQTAWNTPFGDSPMMGPVEDGAQPKNAGGKDFGGFKKIGQDANAQATLVQRAQAVVTVVIENLGKVLDDTKTKITTFATDISTAISAIDWVTIQANFQTGVTDASTKLNELGKIISDFVAGIPGAIMDALGVEGDPQADPVGTSKQVTKKLTISAEAIGGMVNQFVTVLSDGMAAADWGAAGKVIGATVVTILDKFVIWLASFMATVKISDAAEAAGEMAGAAIGGMIIGAIGSAIVAGTADGGTFAEAANDIGWELAAAVLKFIIAGAGSALGQIPVIGDELKKATDNLTATIDATKEAAQAANLSVLQPGSVGIAVAKAQQTPEAQAGMEAAGSRWKDIGINPFDFSSAWQSFTGQQPKPTVDKKAQIPVGQETSALLDQINALRTGTIGPAIPNAMPIAGGSTTGAIGAIGAPVRDKGSETIKSILDFDFASVMPQLPAAQPVPFTDVAPQKPAWETVSTPTQKAKAPAMPEMPAIKMDLSGLDPAKMFQGQVTAATTAGTAAGANFSKAYSTATTTALATAATTGKNVFTPVEKEAPKSATLTWSSFLAGLQQAGGSATTQTGAQGIGTDVIGGIAQGALSAITTSPMLAMVPALLIKFFQSSLGIQSPSLVFDQMVGQPIGEGIIQGLNTVLMGGGTAGMTPQMIMDAMFLGIMNSMSVFTLNMLVGWYNFKSAISTVLLAAESEWMEIFDATFEEANTRFDDFAASWVDEKVPEFKDALIELANQAKDGFLDAMQAAVDGLQDKIDEMLDMLGNEDLLNEFYEKGQALGENIAEGIAAGMTSRHAAGEFAHAAEKIVDMINDAISAAAQIESPSKVMAREIGIPLSAGIAVGMTSPTAQRYLADSSGNVIEQIVRNFQGASTAQVVTARYVRQPEQNVVVQGGGTRNYIMNLSVTPQMAENISYNFGILETMYG